MQSLKMQSLKMQSWKVKSLKVNAWNLLAGCGITPVLILGNVLAASAATPGPTPPRGSTATVLRHRQQINQSAQRRRDAINATRRRQRDAINATRRRQRDQVNAADRRGRANTSSTAINIYGRVISIASSRQLVVRGDNGQTYTVITRNNLASTISRGDRVRLNGRLTAPNHITVDQVVLVQDNSSLNGQKVDFRGTVQGDSARRLMTVRGDDGRTYTVRLNNDSKFARGARVRVVGTYANGIVVATTVTRL